MKKLFITSVVCCVLLMTVSIGHSECGGDINCSGGVDGADLAMLAADFGTTGCGTCDDVIARMEQLENKLAALEELLQHFTRDGNDIYIDGANLHVRDGSGDTDGTVNGLGNLIVGYNEPRGSDDDRTGSHNIVGGAQQNYSSYGGLIAGHFNTISAEYAVVSGGRNNTSSGAYSSVVGGGGVHDYEGNIAFADYSAILGGHTNGTGDVTRTFNFDGWEVLIPGSNHVIGKQATVSGGSFNVASEWSSSVSGGYQNTANGVFASVSGGAGNTASGLTASVSGGDGNTASGLTASVSGGGGNTASGPSASVSGGAGNTASGPSASVSGGNTNTANGSSASVTGGFQNDAQGSSSCMTGGHNNVAIGLGSAVSGGSYNTASITNNSVVGSAGGVYVGSTRVH